MELPFEKTVCRYWKQKLYTLHNQEQTQELRLPDDLPDVERVIASWGQVILRGKEWNDKSIGVQGGILVWMLYQSGSQTEPQRLETWIPFRSRIEGNPAQSEGIVRVQSLLRSVDARVVSSRKLMIRCGLGLLVQALVPAQAEIATAETLPEDVQVLRRRYPMALTVEAGEKGFVLDEELELPGHGGAVQELIYYQLEPALADQKVLGSRAVFHGVGNLHVLYRNEAQQLCSQDFAVPFGQYLDLEQEYDDDAKLHNLLCVSSLELDVQEDGILHLRCGITSQYTVQSRCLLDLVEDAYSPCRDVELTTDTLTLPAILDTAQYALDLTARVDDGGAGVMDAGFRSDFPQLERQGEETVISSPGSFALLLQAQEGGDQSKSVYAEEKMTVSAHCSTDTIAFSWRKGAVECRREGTAWRAQTQVMLDLSTICNQEIPMVTAMKLGQLRVPEPEQPGIILRRMEQEETLWDLAKRCGSTVSAIERLNNLDTQPQPDQLLLIPVL